jgi:hypothetical protein
LVFWVENPLNKSFQEDKQRRLKSGNSIFLLLLSRSFNPGRSNIKGTGDLEITKSKEDCAMAQSSQIII